MFSSIRVEGLNIGVVTQFVKRYEDRRSWRAALKTRYGFAIEEPSITGSVQYVYNNKKFGSVKLHGGSELIQFNEAEPISPLINTSYSLFGEKNYMKLYRKSFCYTGIGSRTGQWSQVWCRS
jgi:hypothetical protein